MDIGIDFYVQKFDFKPADFALAIIDHESGFEFPLESKTGDLGLWGVNKGKIGGLEDVGGLDEVYLIFNPEKNPEKHPNKWHRLYREAFPHVIANYGHLLRGPEEEILEGVANNKEANTVAAFTHISYLVFKYGPKDFLEHYNEGEGNHSPRYKEAVLVKKKKWDNNIKRCDDMKAEYRDFRRDEKEFCNVMNSRFNRYKNNFEKRMEAGIRYSQRKR